jgi:hypothetical protein
VKPGFVGSPHSVPQIPPLARVDVGDGQIEHVCQRLEPLGLGVDGAPIAVTTDPAQHAASEELDPCRVAAQNAAGSDEARMR